jgi:hypothetical protein
MKGPIRDRTPIPVAQHIPYFRRVLGTILLYFLLDLIKNERKKRKEVACVPLPQPTAPK